MMVTAKQLSMLQWAIDMAYQRRAAYFYTDELESYDAKIKAAENALAAVRSDYRAARLARRQQAPAPRRALQRVAIKEKGE